MVVLVGHWEPSNIASSLTERLHQHRQHTAGDSSARRARNHA